jgi:hypothetical protein
MNPSLQQRFQVYVLGPNQDARLSSVAAGATLNELKLVMDDDAPFVLTGRGVRHSYTSSLNQTNLQNLKSRWAGPNKDYRSEFIRESLVMAYYGQGGNPKPIAPSVMYPASSVLLVDAQNKGTGSITNLTYYFFGYKLYEWGSVVGYTYPQKPKTAQTQTFAYPVNVTPALGVSETRPDQIFSVKDDADFVLRAGQGPTFFSTNGRVFAEVGIILRDFDKKPYMNDYVHFDMLFGNGATPAVIPVGPTPSFVAPYGTGPGQPGLFYPEIYIPANHQLRFDLQRTDGSGGSNQSETFTFNLIGSKVFQK